jgi:hypothetical protein
MLSYVPELQTFAQVHKRYTFFRTLQQSGYSIVDIKSPLSAFLILLLSVTRNMGFVLRLNIISIIQKNLQSDGFVSNLLNRSKTEIY